MTTIPYPIADVSLARRIERAEARGNACFVETRARLVPESGACWIEVAGASAIFDGPESPITQTFGLGLLQPATAGDRGVLHRATGADLPRGEPAGR